MIESQENSSNFKPLAQLPKGAFLAPMAGLTDSPFRILARRYGAGLVYTECVSAEGLRRGSPGSLDLVRFHPEERPIAVQLFGSEPMQLAEAAAVVAERSHPDLIDLNCGCPVKKFVTNGYGGWLMQFPDLIGRCVEAVKAASGLPVSVKLRSGYIAPVETAPQAAAAAETAGAFLVAIHARYVRKSREGAADWTVIKRVKSAVRHLPVVGNGDVFSVEDARRMIQETGCDRVMIGRGACGRPWFFQQLRDDLNDYKPLDDPLPSDRITTLIEHYLLALNHFPERTAVNRMRKHIGWYIHRLPGAAALRSQVMTMTEAAQVIASIRGYQQNFS